MSHGKGDEAQGIVDVSKGRKRRYVIQEKGDMDQRGVEVCGGEGM